MANLGPFQLLIILLLVLLLFGTKRIRTLGSDLGGAIRDFRKGVSEDAEGGKSDKSGDIGRSAAESSSSESNSSDSSKTQS